MSVQDALARVLERLSDTQVDALATACEPCAAPPADLASVVAGAAPGTTDAVSHLLTAWGSQPTLTGAGVALALRTGLAARQFADDRRARAVWTGPGTIGEERLTAGVLHELLTAARERILLVSYAAHTLPAVAADLEAAVNRGCRVDVVFETTADSSGSYTGPDRPFAHLAGIHRWHWPADHREPGAVLHAKLLIVDSCRALIGSANLTHRALTANIEVGVLITDPDIAAALERHTHALMQHAFVQSDT